MISDTWTPLTFWCSANVDGTSLGWLSESAIIFTKSQLAEFRASGNLPDIVAYGIDDEVDASQYLDLSALKVLLNAAPATAPAPSAIKVTVNGVEIEFDQPPVIENGRTLVPLRAIFEALGATLAWDGATQTVTAVKDDTTITLQIGSNILVKNGQSIILEVPAKIVNGRTLVPARAVAESFGANVAWDSNTQTAIITTN